MGKTTLLVLIALIATMLPQPSGRAQSMSDDEKRQAFIESRRSSSAPAATPAPTRRSSSSGSTGSRNTGQRVTGNSSSSREKTRRSTKPKVAPRKSESTRSRSNTRSTPRPTPRSTPSAAAEEVTTPFVTPETASEPFIQEETPVSTPRTRARPTPRPRATPRQRAAPTPRATPERRTEQRTRRSNPDSRHQRHRSHRSSGASSDAAIVISKTGLQGREEYLPPVQAERGGWFRRGPKYKYLTPHVRQSIDNARIRKGRWVNIVIHNSATRQGSAKAFDYYHRRVRKMENGLAYHFVIGNGTSTGNGQIEIGQRWTRQINGGHVRSNRLNDISLGICFVGDYNRDRPHREQLEALQELVVYLRKRLGKTEGKYARVETHKGINPVPTSCPGDRFPYKWFYQSFGKR